MCFLGIDAGTERVKTILMKNDAVAANAAAEIGTDSVFAAINRCLDEMEKQLNGAGLNIIAAGITGASSEYAEMERYEFPFQKYRIASSTASGISFLSPVVRTVIDIGADNYIVMKCEDGHVLKMERNNTCASGTGGYLVKVSEILGLNLFADSSLPPADGTIPSVSSTCAVFVETEIISLIHRKEKPQNILRGVYNGVADKINVHVVNIGAEREFAVVGGASKNIALVKCLEERLGESFVNVPLAEYVAAVGASRLISKKS